MKLKSVLPLLLGAVLAGAGFSSCSKEGSNEFHQFSVYPLRSQGFYAFADQSTDSTTIVSTDTWTCTCETDWLGAKLKAGKAAPFTVEVKEGYISYTPIVLTFQPNLTGKARTGVVTCTSQNSEMGTMSLPVVQYGNLNITTPNGVLGQDSTYSWKLETVAADGKYHYTYEDTEKTYSPYVIFTVYAEGATLKSSASWLKIGTTTTSNGTSSNGFTPGSAQRVSLNIEENNTGADREAYLTLTSAGVSNQIRVVQSH